MSVVATGVYLLAVVLAGLVVLALVDILTVPESLAGAAVVGTVLSATVTLLISFLTHHLNGVIVYLGPALVGGAGFGLCRIFGVDPWLHGKRLRARITLKSWRQRWVIFGALAALAFAF